VFSDGIVGSRTDVEAERGWPIHFHRNLSRLIRGPSELRPTVYLYGVTVPGGRIGGAEDVPYGRLELVFGLACASQRCNHVLNGHALAIVRIDKARLDPFIPANDEGSRDGKHPGGIALIIRDVPTRR
jgi:hypothetical protein